MVSISLGLGLGSSGGPVDPPPIPGFVYLTENSGAASCYGFGTARYRYVG